MGSDQITLRGHRGAPAGVAHAVDLDGEVLCREERPRYYFPWLDWLTEAAPDADRVPPCQACTTIALERALPAAAGDPYPVAAPVVTQSAIDWLRYPQDFTVWSASL